MHSVLLRAIYKPIHHHQLIGRRKVLLNHTSAACRLDEGGIVSFVFVTGGIPPVSVASHIFLCSFHRIQAWLQWLMNGKNGVSQYKDQCMSILHSLGESKTEDEYKRNLLHLQKSHIWSHFPNLRNYYTQQWAPKKKVNISENK